MSGPDRTSKRKTMRTTGILQPATAPVKTQTAHSSVSRAVPRTSEAVIVVTTAGGKTFNVMRDQLTGEPRQKFVDELVEMIFKAQENGEPHQWTVKG